MPDIESKINPDPFPAGHADVRTPRWWVVHIGVVLAFALFFIFVALLYWNWLRIQEPTAALRITGGSPAYDGVIVRVEGRNLREPLELTLGRHNHYGGRIYLRQGVYRVSALRDGKTLFEAGEASIYEWGETTLTLPDPQTLSLPSPASES